LREEQIQLQQRKLQNPEIKDEGSCGIVMLPL